MWAFSFSQMFSTFTGYSVAQIAHRGLFATQLRSSVYEFLKDSRITCSFLHLSSAVIHRPSPNSLAKSARNWVSLKIHIVVSHQPFHEPLFGIATTTTLKHGTYIPIFFIHSSVLIYSSFLSCGHLRSTALHMAELSIPNGPCSGASDPLWPPSSHPFLLSAHSSSPPLYFLTNTTFISPFHCQKMWRICSAIVAALLAGTGLIAYMLARLLLLRKQLESAFYAINWANFLPHIWQSPMRG